MNCCVVSSFPPCVRDTNYRQHLKIELLPHGPVCLDTYTACWAEFLWFLSTSALPGFPVSSPWVWRGRDFVRGITILKLATKTSGNLKIGHFEQTSCSMYSPKTWSTWDPTFVSDVACVCVCGRPLSQRKFCVCREHGRFETPCTPRAFMPLGQGIIRKMICTRNTEFSSSRI